MSATDAEKMKLSGLDELIERLMREMMMVTVESVDPWIPFGGSFSISYESLPQDVDLEEVSRTIGARLSEVRGVSLERVAIEQSDSARQIPGPRIVVYVKDPRS